MSDLTREQSPVKIFYDFGLQQNLGKIKVKKGNKVLAKFFMILYLEKSQTMGGHEVRIMFMRSFSFTIESYVHGLMCNKPVSPHKWV